MRSSLRRQLLHLATDLSALEPTQTTWAMASIWSPAAMPRQQPVPAALLALPEPVLQAGNDGDDTWLHQRVRHTHDLWHVVCGCPPTAAGEADVGQATAYGLELGWDRPLTEWREQLGITALVANAPFKTETPRS